MARGKGQAREPVGYLGKERLAEGTVCAKAWRWEQTWTPGEQSGNQSGYSIVRLD